MLLALIDIITMPNEQIFTKFLWVGPSQRKNCFHFVKDSAAHIVDMKAPNFGG